MNGFIETVKRVILICATSALAWVENGHAQIMFVPLNAPQLVIHTSPHLMEGHSIFRLFDVDWFRKVLYPLKGSNNANRVTDSRATKINLCAKIKLFQIKKIVVLQLAMKVYSLSYESLSINLTNFC